MKKIITLLLSVPVFHAHAQNVGIGTDTPTHPLHVLALSNPLRLEGLVPGAISDSIVTVDTAGVLHKRNGSINISLTGWSTTGNSGTNTANNFIGTTDNIPLLIKTNSQQSGYIEPSASLRNNSLGYRSFGTTVTGNGNNAFGYQSLSSLSSGSNNTAIGDSAAFALTVGNDNVAVGSRALSATGSGGSNVAIGTGALKYNLASENIAIGKEAAHTNVAGSNILAIGTGALQNNKNSNTQLAIGGNALQLITGGQENIAIGYNSGLSVTSSNYNVLLGHYTLSSTTGSSRNVVIGHNAALAYTGTGQGDNVFIGYQSALTQTDGNGNTFIGSGTDVAGNLTPNNSTAVGQSVLITANNQVRIGNTSVNSIGGQVGWTTFSDARIKANIREDVPGMAFIEKLRPVTYNYNLQSLAAIQGKPLATGYQNIESIRFTGLIAQEVEAAAKSLGYDFSGIDKPANANSPYGIRYAELVVPMIKAMQEMKQQLEQQQKEIDALKKQLEKKTN